MSINIRLPKISAGDDAGKLLQVQSYMYQLVEQLNYALNNIESGGNGTSSQTVTGSSATVSNTSAQDIASTFASIKALIIKSADIVDAYYEQMKLRFDGAYIAQSDFGDYMESYWQEIDINPTDITQMFSDIQAIQSKVTELENTIIATEAYIKHGLLGYDENSVPIYGIEIGQTTEVNGESVFDKFARFTAGGVYFYVPGVDAPLAYFTTEAMFITNAYVSGTLQVGNFLWDQSAGGLTLKWVGG